MPRIEFEEATSTFLLTTDNGEIIPYHYYPNSKNVWGNLKDEDFQVVLLNNPFLHRELDVFEVRFDGSNERGGFLFPIALLESEEVEGKQLLSYMLVAFRVLLSHIGDELTGVLSDSFKDAFILVVQKGTVPHFTFSEYQLSLASNGFYMYQGMIKDEYPSLQVIQDHKKILRLSKREKDNTSIGYVKDLVENRLCSASDFLTRFILVYQVVELYISEIHDNLLEDAIERYKQSEITRNDFGEELKIISREGYRIDQLMKGLDEEVECNNYKRDVMGLFNDIGYKPKNQSLPALLYTFRNQIFHNYDKFIGHEDTLTQVIFSFERVILKVLSKRLIIKA